MAEASQAAGGFGRMPSFYGPEGRLVFVDSALEAVSRGSTTIGIKTPSFALLASHIKPARLLMEPAEKVFSIDGHVGATGSGYIGDILQLIDELRLESQKHRLSFESPIDVGSLAKHLGRNLTRRHMQFDMICLPVKKAVPACARACVSRYSTSLSRPAGTSFSALALAAKRTGRLISCSCRLSST
ncbi:MAG: hypothetical protein C4292_06600 [Nitrososphaera sp.]